MKILDGRKSSQKLQAEIKEKVSEISSLHKRPPCLAVVLVGEDPASQVYVGHKVKACEKAGIGSMLINLKTSTTENEVLSQVKALNENPEVDAILVQLPLPKHIDSHKVMNSIRPEKDADGLTELSLGKLFAGKAIATACTPTGIIQILKDNNIKIEGQHAVVIGRSQIVGLPMFLLLQQNNATVTLCHSRTKDLKHHTKQADILVVAAGKESFIDNSYVKPGATVIDVGIHRTDDGLRGDVKFKDFESEDVNITPVPGGVGPMTIAMLLQNTLKLYEHHQKS